MDFLAVHFGAPGHIICGTLELNGVVLAVACESELPPTEVAVGLVVVVCESEFPPAKASSQYLDPDLWGPEYAIGGKISEENDKFYLDQYPKERGKLVHL